ncbi:hypothetical protein NEK97_02475 [Paenarthrobacter sp. UW852]|uniref:hypothetical protein n=1 Tax=Paenarthrobacter sp. UW852 TaxID=2951989 RepID=UPI002148F348|nr:hypothetical protein [Paenarthrobacter sp. UW852]MCR1160326.1 hypothetical protein [Paenarthrobacter sp. UW852]
MPMLPGDSSRKTPKSLADGSKGKNDRFVVRGKDGGLRAAGGSGKSVSVSRSAKTGRFVTDKGAKRSPSSTVNESIQIEAVASGAATRISRALRNQLAHGFTKAPAAEPITVRVYLDTDDAVVAFQAVQALEVVLAGAGYGRTKIESVDRGSLRLRLKAWLDGDDGQKAHQAAKNKLGEAAVFADRWAKDFTVNIQRAEISAINANTAYQLMESVKDVENVALQMDEWLIVKYKDAQGEPVCSVRKLSVTELWVLDRSPGILNNPSKALDNLALLAYEQEKSHLAIES